MEKSINIFIICYFLFFGYSLALDCIQQWQCLSVTEDYNYVQCVDNVCQCRSNLGFEGTATANDPCRCSSPKSVHWDSSDPYCLSFEDCTETEQNSKRTEILKQKVIEIYENFKFPTPLLIQSGNKSVDHLFSPNVKARVVPLGVLSRQILLDYLYVLATTPTTRSIDYAFREIVATGDSVFVTADVLFEDFSVTPSRLYNISEMARYLFDETDRVISLELYLREFGKVSDPPLSDRNRIIEETCTFVPLICPQQLDPTGYYENYSDCLNFMTNEIPFGTFDKAGSDTFLCRMLYSLMALYHPEIHCPSVGKTGGTQCVDVTYESYYLENY